MEHEQKTKRRVYLWILFAALLFFPLIWMLQPSVASPYSTALQVTDSQPVVDPIHPLAPNRIERFGTDPLGRPVTTLLAKSLPPAMGMALAAAALRALLGTIAGRFRFRPKLPAWVWMLAEIVLYGFLFSLPFFIAGIPSDHYLLLTVLLGLYFFPAIHEDRTLRRIGLLIMEQFMRIMLLLAVLGLLGRTIGENPYGAIPTSMGRVPFTYPFLTNVLAAVQQTGLKAWWVWGIPLAAVLILVLGVLLAKMPMQNNYERRGEYFTNLTQDFVNFLNPVQTVKELIRFKHHLAKNVLRVILVLLIVLFFTWGAAGSSNTPYTPVYNSFAEIQTELSGITTPEQRLQYAENMIRDSNVNPPHREFRIQSREATLVAGVRPGVSRTQPLLLVFDVGADETTFALQTALYRAVLDNARNVWLQQSIVFAFTDSPDADFREALHISGNGFYAALDDLTSEPVMIDETLVYPGNSWAGAIAGDFRYGFSQHAIPVELTWLQPQNPLALSLSEQGFMGIQLRGGSKTDPQATLEALTDAVMRYGMKERQYR